MRGTATASLWARSSADWPPRLKRPIRWPVLPRFLVGMALVVAGFERVSEAAWVTVGRAVCPTTAAAARPPSLRNSRRFGFKLSAISLLRISWDFPLSFRPKTGVGLFRDFLPAP